MLKTTTLAVACAAALCVPAAQAEKLSLAHGFPPSHAVVTKGFQPFMACVQDGTKGAITFDHFPSGQVATFNTALDTLNKGLAQVSGIIVATASSKLPLNGVAMLPDMGNTSVELVTAYRKTLSAGGPLADEFRANKVRPLLVNLLPPFQVLGGAQAIDSLDKFRGKKMRVSGGTMNFMANSLESTPVEVSADMYFAMKQGTLDGLFLALSSVKPYNLQEIVKSISGNGSFGSGITALSIDEGVFAKLPADQQKVLTDCGHKVEIDLARDLDAGDNALKTEFAAAGIQVYKFSDAERAAISTRLRTVSQDFITRLKGRGLPAQEAYDAYRKQLGR